MLQKDVLGQDMFLLGPPGPKRRHLAMQYLELTNREHEYVALNRDTTESDLKQRREIVAGTATYFDQVQIIYSILGFHSLFGLFFVNKQMLFMGNFKCKIVLSVFVTKSFAFSNNGK